MKKGRKRLKNAFIPHEGNDHKPTILRPRTVIFISSIAIVLELVFLVSSSTIIPRSKLFGIILTNALVSELNTARAENNVPQLQESPLLDEAAQEKANDEVQNNYFAHTSPSGVTPWYWFGNVGYNFTIAGENLAVNFSDSQDVTNAWLNSPEHRANMLNAGFTQVGMATANGTFQGHPAVYVVEDFGTPSLIPVQFVNENSATSTPTPKNTTAPNPSSTESVGSVAGTSSTNKNAKAAPVIAVETTGTPQATSPNQTFVEVAGVTTGTLATTTTATSTATSTNAATTTSVVTGSISPDNTPPPATINFIQKAASEPLAVVDYTYLALAVLFGGALILNIFVKIRIQHPQLIMGGMLVILIAGLFIVLNQHIGLGGAAIL